MQPAGKVESLKYREEVNNDNLTAPQMEIQDLNRSSWSQRHLPLNEGGLKA